MIYEDVCLLKEKIYELYDSSIPNKEIMLETAISEYLYAGRVYYNNPNLSLNELEDLVFNESKEVIKRNK